MPRKNAQDESSTTQESKSKDDLDQQPQQQGQDGKQKQEDPISINLNNITELKNTCDDAVKEFFGDSDHYKTSHTHTDIKLGLGFLATVTAGATAWYGYITPFQEAKFWAAIGVALYGFLTVVAQLHSYYFVKDTIFNGWRKSAFTGRIETEKINVSTIVPPHPPLKSWNPFAKQTSNFQPSYKVTLSYNHLSNGGKSLIRRDEVSFELFFSQLFDQDGTFVRKHLTNVLESNLKKVEGKSS